MSCPCCASGELQKIGNLPDSHWFAGTQLAEPLPGGALYRCGNCALKFRSPTQTEAAYQQLYDNAATSTWDSGSTGVRRADWDQIIRYLGQACPAQARVLDVGCYTGGLLDQLGSRYRRFGVDINAAAAEVASQHTDRPVWASIDEIPQDLDFDVIVATDVVEHVINPLAFIEHLASRLTDNGVLIITTGDADNRLWNRFGANWWYCFYPEHISFLSKRWLDHMENTTAISVVNCETFRYANSVASIPATDPIFVYWYGWFPSSFLGFVRLINRWRGRQHVTSVPGAGISDDHLFIVLKRATAS